MARPVSLLSIACVITMVAVAAEAYHPDLRGRNAKYNEAMSKCSADILDLQKHFGRIRAEVRKYAMMLLVGFGCIAKAMTFIETLCKSKMFLVF